MFHRLPIDAYRAHAAAPQTYHQTTLAGGVAFAAFAAVVAVGVYATATTTMMTTMLMMDDDDDDDVDADYDEDRAIGKVLWHAHRR